jgi:hypothetical protein
MEVRVDGKRRRFGAARYGKTEFEASRGQAIGAADIQRFMSEAGSIGKRYHAVLKNAFDHGIRCGRTTYNPCDKVTPPATTRARASRWSGNSRCSAPWRRP